LQKLQATDAAFMLDEGSGRVVTAVAGKISRRRIFATIAGVFLRACDTIPPAKGALFCAQLSDRGQCASQQTFTTRRDATIGRLSD
jgi:hypothetical protein